MAAGGRFLLRIEDIDIGRTRPEFVDGIFEDLAWLGLAWEEPVLFQSQRFDAYRAAAQQLEAMGLLYPCFATRRRSRRRHTGGGRIPTARRSIRGYGRAAAPDEIAHMRETGDAFRAAHRHGGRRCAAARASLGGRPLTFTELGEDGAAADRGGAAGALGRCGDRAEGRADELSPGRGGGRCLAGRDARHPRARPAMRRPTCTGCCRCCWACPSPIYHHHRLIVDESGRKLAKSAKDTSLRELRAQGATPAEVRRLVGLAPGAATCR